MSQMDLTDLIKRYSELKEESSERYLSGLIDFFKWTTTLAFAVVIWIGTNSKNLFYESNWLFFSIIFIMGSIIIATITTYRILDFWNKIWKLNFHLHKLLTIHEVNEKHPFEIKEEELKSQQKLVMDSAAIMFELKRFDIYLIFHIVVLFIGIIFYLFAIYL